MVKKLNKKRNNLFWNLIFNALFATFTLLIVINFYNNIFLTFSLLIFVSIIGLIKWRSKTTLIVFFIGGILGPLSEIVAINYGAWSYTNSNFLNIPIWLLLLWGNASVFIHQTAKEIGKFLIKK